MAYSNLTIGTGDVSFALQFEDATIGSALISNLIITPGSANYSTDVHYQPQGSAVSIGETLLENSLQGIDSDTTILGSTDTTPIDSLKPALAEVQLSPVVIPSGAAPEHCDWSESCIPYRHSTDGSCSGGIHTEQPFHGGY